MEPVDEKWHYFLPDCARKVDRFLDCLYTCKGVYLYGFVVKTA